MTLFGAILSSKNVGPTYPTQSAATPGATVSIDVTLGTLYTWTAGENETVNATGTQVAGQVMIFLIANDATSARTITFGTGFKPSATIVGMMSKTASIAFVSDGTSLWELSRTSGL